MKARREFIKRLGEAAGRKAQSLRTVRKLKIVYDPSFNIGDTDDAGEIEAAFRQCIRRNREKELQKSTTMAGPQRDDIDIRLNGESTGYMPPRVSRGLRCFR